MNNKRPNRHTNPSKYNRRLKKKGRTFIRKKKRETKELLRRVM